MYDDKAKQATLGDGGDCDVDEALVNVERPLRRAVEVMGWGHWMCAVVSGWTSRTWSRDLFRASMIGLTQAREPCRATLPDPASSAIHSIQIAIDYNFRTYDAKLQSLAIR